MEISNAQYFVRLIDKYCLSQIFVYLGTLQHKDQQPSFYESLFAAGAATGFSSGKLSVQ